MLIYFPYFLAGAVIESRRDRLIASAGALVWSGVLIACIALTAGLAGRGKAQRAAK